jgi:hypothetical protein
MKDRLQGRKIKCIRVEIVKNEGGISGVERETRLREGPESRFLRPKRPERGSEMGRILRRKSMYLTKTVYPLA